MAKIYVDTSSVKDYGNNLIKISSSFKSDINNLYNRIYNVPTTTKEWVGIASTNYASAVLKEKKQYTNYGDEIKKMGNILIDYAEDVEKIVRRTKI